MSDQKKKLWYYSTWWESFVLHDIIDFLENGKFANVCVDECIWTHVRLAEKIEYGFGQRYFPKVLLLSDFQDKNGNALIEGDVVDFEFDNDSSYTRSVVFFCNEQGSFALCHFSKAFDNDENIIPDTWWGEGWTPKADQKDLSHRVKVGNILENPNLLGYDRHDSQLLLSKKVEQIFRIVS